MKTKLWILSLLVACFVATGASAGGDVDSGLPKGGNPDPRPCEDPRPDEHLRKIPWGVALLGGEGGSEDRPFELGGTDTVR